MPVCLRLPKEWHSAAVAAADVAAVAVVFVAVEVEVVGVVVCVSPASAGEVHAAPAPVGAVHAALRRLRCLRRLRWLCPILLGMVASLGLGLQLLGKLYTSGSAIWRRIGASRADRGGREAGGRKFNRRTYEIAFRRA